MSPSERSPREGPQEGSTPPHFWQVPEAEEELTTLGPTLRQLRGKVGRLSEVEAELERMAALWGNEFEAPDHPDAARKRTLEAQARTLHGEVGAVLEMLHQRGIEIKDLAHGLVDFYALRKGEIIFLCWKSGEDGIHHWHPLDGGFRGRRPLTSAERAGGLDALSRSGGGRSEEGSPRRSSSAGPSSHGDA